MIVLTLSLLSGIVLGNIVARRLDDKKDIKAFYDSQLIEDNDEHLYV